MRKPPTPSPVCATLLWRPPGKLRQVLFQHRHGRQGLSRLVDWKKTQNARLEPSRLFWSRSTSGLTFPGTGRPFKPRRAVSQPTWSSSPLSLLSAQRRGDSVSPLKTQQRLPHPSVAGISGHCHLPPGTKKEGAQAHEGCASWPFPQDHWAVQAGSSHSKSYTPSIKSSVLTYSRSNRQEEEDGELGDMSLVKIFGGKEGKIQGVTQENYQK